MYMRAIPIYYTNIRWIRKCPFILLFLVLVDRVDGVSRDARRPKLVPKSLPASTKNQHHHDGRLKHNFVSFTGCPFSLSIEAMAESSSTDDLIQLFKRFSAFLSLKLSHFFNFASHKLDLFSVGAIAGLAIAVIFTWRLSSPQRRQPKRQTARASSSGVNSQSNATVVSSAAAVSSEDSGAQNVVDDFFQPVKPTLAQIVRQKLCEGRKVTCRLLGVVLEETSPEELQKKATVRSCVLEVLLEITKFCDLYLMERVLDDESEKRVLLALEEAGIFTSGGLVRDKVLFCSTENGRTSFVRQLEPDWHIDTNPEIVSQLARFIRYQLHISTSKPERMASNVFCSPSLEHFFGYT